MSVSEPKKRNRILSWFAATLWGAVLPLYAYKVWLKTDYTDFDVYYRAAARMKAGLWNDIYTLADGASPFRYAPLTLPIFRPFAQLPLPYAKEAWYFLQYGWFALGFCFIYRSLKDGKMSPRAPRAMTTTAFASLFILRFCLDCFTIGQTSSLLFLCFCIAFWAWSIGRHAIASSALFVPAAVKIGPAFLYPLLLQGNPKQQLRAVLTPILGTVLVLVITTLVIGPWDRNIALWHGWMGMVFADSQYFDASHYGSQSIKSFLLRASNAHWISPAAVTWIYLSAALAICGSVLSFWFLRSPKSSRGRALFFCLGLFTYIWLMPETFKYSLTVLAMPAALLLDSIFEETSTRARRFTIAALAFGAFTMSIAGLDIVGETVFFGLQKLSIPLLATFGMAAALARLAWRESAPSPVWRIFEEAIVRPSPAPWAHEAPAAKLDVSLLVPLPMDFSKEADFDRIAATLNDLCERLRARHPGSFEAIFQPYGRNLKTPGLFERVHRFASGRSEMKILATPVATRSLALRQAFLASSGRAVLFFQSEQPGDVTFYERAFEDIRSNKADLVRANRRLAESRFRIPVRILRLIYRRHRMGLRFNRLVRSILPITTTDTHSGTWALKREVAAQIFALQSSGDFLFDLEIALIARAHGFREKDLPVALFVPEEKNAHRIVVETLTILLGMPTLARRYRAGFYHPLKLDQNFTADDWGLSPEVNEGILELARRGIIRRVSMMTRTKYLSHALTELKAIPGVSLGLHFDLTYGVCSPSKVLLQWIRFSDKQKLAQDVRQELEAQLQALRAQGVSPSYIDGHHHIHLVPGILDAIAPTLKAQSIQQVRIPYDPSLWMTGKASLNILALLARRRARAQGFASLHCFYPQKSHFKDPGLFRACLARNAGSEVIVHPARTNDLEILQIADPYTEGRVLEFRALRMLNPGGSV